MLFAEAVFIIESNAKQKLDEPLDQHGGLNGTALRPVRLEPL